MGGISLTDGALNGKKRTYVAIDLKSFYSSVECVARGLDPLTTNLVVADVSRTEKTICLAVSPSMKAYGLGGRARLFEVVEKMREVNCEIYGIYLRYIAPADIHDDIINLPHHVSQRHPRMSMYNRAAQFSPFAALTGYEKAIEEAQKS